MIMNLRYKLFFLGMALLFSFSVSAQSNRLKLNLDDEGKTYIKASLRGQFWARYMSMNPGTKINGEDVSEKLDFSIRRLRVGVSAQLTPKLFVFSAFGGNNINFRTEKTFDFDLLDFGVEYAFGKGFALGIGENGWEGLSRWCYRSSLTLMSVDAPLFSLFTVNKNDDLARGLGIWAKGQFSKFDYVLSLKNPTDYGVIAREGYTDFALNNPRLRTSGYVKYQFFEHESNKSAYSGATGTYIGQKKVLSFGAGFLYQPKMTARLVRGQKVYYDFQNWALEVFYDTPLGSKGSAITTYLGYFDTDFGKDYIRNVGANGYASGGTTFNGPGNSFPMIGTGGTIFMQIGYLLPKNTFGEKNADIRVQPNLAVQHSSFDALLDAMTVYDLGVNIFFKGHANKLSLNYQSRPIYYYQGYSSKPEVKDRKGQLVLQYQITIN